MSNLPTTSRFFLVIEAIMNEGNGNWREYAQPPESEQLRKLRAMVGEWLDRNKGEEIAAEVRELRVRLHPTSWTELAEELNAIFRGDPHPDAARMTLVKTLLAELREFERVNANRVQFNRDIGHQPRRPRTQTESDAHER